MTGRRTSRGRILVAHRLLLLLVILLLRRLLVLILRRDGRLLRLLLALALGGTGRLAVAGGGVAFVAETHPYFG